MKKLAAFVWVSLLCAGIPACGRRPLSPAEAERNVWVSQILRREDMRILGNDDFFPTHLADNGRPGIQQRCALALGRIGDPRSLPWLFRELRSPSAAVRAAAVFAIGEIEERTQMRSEGRAADPNVTAEIESLLDDSSLQVRMRATEALGKAGTPSDAPAIIRRLQSYPYSGTPEERSYLALAITALTRLGNPAAHTALVRLAAMPDPEIQWRVANAIYRMRDREARPVLEQMLHSPDPDVRAHASRALGICGDPGLAAQLLPLIRTGNPQGEGSPPLSVRISALQGLASLGNPAAAPDILESLQPGSAPDDVNFAVQALTVLGRLGSEEAVPTLRHWLQPPGPAADSAVNALAGILQKDPDRFFSTVAGIRFDTPAGIRAWAAALGRLGGERSIRELRLLLERGTADGEDGRYRLALPSVLQALNRAHDPGLQGLLRAFLESSDGVVLRACVAGYEPSPADPAPWRPLIQAYAGISGGLDAETEVAILDRLEPWSRAMEVQEFLRNVLRGRVRNARIAAARLLRVAGARDVPDDPGPAVPRMTEIGYNQLAAMRQDRTTAVLETTRGPIEIELFRDDAPITVANFISLARSGFFDGLSFMRVVPYFVIQGGDPRNDQEGGPGYTIPCEINMRPFERGSVGMALAGKDTGGSQFFITLSPQPHLDGGYTCFGRVISGMSAADHMVAGDIIAKVRIREDVTMIDYRTY